MKIITVFNNYKSAESSDVEKDSRLLPGWFFLPDSTLMKSGNPFYIPNLEGLFQNNEVSTECMAFPSLVIRLSRLGKNIDAQFTRRYMAEVGLCVNFIAEDIRRSRAAAGLSWTESVSFDRSFLCGNFSPIDFDRLNSIEIISMLKRADGSLIEKKWQYANLIHKGDEMLSRISRMNTIKIGDLFVPGLPDEGFPVSIGDTLEVRADNIPSLSVMMK